MMFICTYHYCFSLVILCSPFVGITIIVIVVVVMARGHLDRTTQQLHPQQDKRTQLHTNTHTHTVIHLANTLTHPTNKRKIHPKRRKKKNIVDNVRNTMIQIGMAREKRTNKTRKRKIHRFDIYVEIESLGFSPQRN